MEKEIKPEPTILSEKQSTINKQISKQIDKLEMTISENTDISLVTKWVKILSNVFLITLPFVPLFFPLAGGKKTKKHKGKFVIKK
jgi:hypothetical protein